jgi:hypothetical protein
MVRYFGYNPNIILILPLIMPRYVKGECRTCDYLKEDEVNEEEIVEAHLNCHGWSHCGPDCCGVCEHCNDEGYDESNYVPITPMAAAIIAKVEKEWRNK